jgi:hypothetical protein
MKAQNEARRMQLEEQSHMELEELLHAEAGVTRQPTVASSKLTRLAEARRAPVQVLPPITRQANDPRLDAHNLRKLGGLQGNTKGIVTKGIDRLQTQFANSPSKAAGTMVRLPAPIRPNLNGGVTGATAPSQPQRLYHNADEGIAAFREFVRTIDTHDKKVTRAQKAYLAETAGQVPIIMDFYRPITLVDGRRQSPSTLSPEQADSGRRAHESIKVIAPEPDLGDALLAEALSAGVREPKKRKKPTGPALDISRVISTLDDLNKKGILAPKALSASVPTTTSSVDLLNGQSGISDPGIEPIAPVILGAEDSPTTPPARVDGPSDIGKGSSLVDLAALVNSPTAPDRTMSTNAHVTMTQAQPSSVGPMALATHPTSPPAVGEQIVDVQDQMTLLDLSDHPVVGPLSADEESGHGQDKTYAGLGAWLAKLAKSNSDGENIKDKSGTAGTSTAAVPKPEAGSGGHAGDLLLAL